MIKFMVLAAPRSGTAWAANWLTTDKRYCLHDPLFIHHYSDLDALAVRMGDRDLGVACTGLALFPEFVNAHPCRKIVLHRSSDEINTALGLLGLPRLNEPAWDGALQKINGLHLPWKALFENPAPITNYLFNEEPEWDRHRLLKGMNIQREISAIRGDPMLAFRLRSEIFDRTGTWV